MRSYIMTIFLSGTTLLLTGFLILYPNEALSASLRGLTIWAEVVFPSLLPFFIIAELLIAFGVVKFLGVMFEPIMRPVFNVPGAGSFGWIMGMASGYPTGARITARLREDKQLTQLEAERLVAFTNNSSPLFIFGAISVGFFHNQFLGLLLAVCHYGSNLLVGILMRFHGMNKERKQVRKKEKKFPSVRDAIKQMHITRMEDSRPFGEVLGDAVLHSIRTLIMVGGFIILFSVITRLFHIVDFSTFIAYLFKGIFNLLLIPTDLALPFFTGLFEITIGANLIAQTEVDAIFYQVVLVSFILGFNGFSIQAQVASILAKTDIRFTPYFIARIFHGLIASILTVLLYRPLYEQRISLESSAPNSYDSTALFFNEVLLFLSNTGFMITIFSLLIASMLLFRYKKRDGY